MMIQPISDRQLRYWFNRINRIAFDGRLHAAFEFKNFKDGGAAYTEKVRGKDIFYIAINKKIRYSPSCTIISLAHEMIHVEHRSWGHGSRFQKRMLQVIRRAKLEKFL